MPKEIDQIADVELAAVEVETEAIDPLAPPARGVAGGGAGQSLVPVVSAEAADALDSLFKASRPDSDKPDDKPDDKPADPKPTGEVVEDPEIDTLSLPPHSSESAKESFRKLKEASKEKLAAIKKEAEELREKLTKAEQEAQNRLPSEASKELEDLRKWRKVYDIERDPEFTSQYDAKVTSAENAILKKLKDSEGATEKHLKRIEELGGVRKVDWNAKVLAGLSPSTRRFVEAKLVEIESLEVEKQEAVAKAKEEADKWEKDRENRTVQTLQSKAQEFVAPIEWLKPVPIPSTATPEEKAKLENQNKQATHFSSMLQGFLKQKQTPEWTAELAVGTMLAYKFNSDISVLQQQIQSIDQAKAEAVKEKEAITKERDELKAKLDGIKKAGSLSRGSRSAPAVPSGTQVNINPADHLDSLYKGVRRAN
jgi:hypothetical protein